MRKKTMFSTQPKNADIFKSDNGNAFVCLRENIESIQLMDGETSYQADEYTLTVPYSAALGERIAADFDSWLTRAKKQDHNAAAASIRQKRDTLLSSTDKDCLSDRYPSNALLAYRQALRDVPEQDGFPYDVSWPMPPEKALSLPKNAKEPTTPSAVSSGTANC